MIDRGRRATRAARDRLLQPAGRQSRSSASAAHRARGDRPSRHRAHSTQIVHTIVFARARVTAEVLLTYLREALPHQARLARCRARLSRRLSARAAPRNRARAARRLGSRRSSRRTRWSSGVDIGSLDAVRHDRLPRHHRQHLAAGGPRRAARRTCRWRCWSPRQRRSISSSCSTPTTSSTARRRTA